MTSTWDIRPMIPSGRACGATRRVEVVPGARRVLVCTLDDEHLDRGERHGAGVPWGRQKQEIKYEWEGTR